MNARRRPTTDRTPAATRILLAGLALLLLLAVFPLMPPSLAAGSCQGTGTPPGKSAPVIQSISQDFGAVAGGNAVDIAGCNFESGPTGVTVVKVVSASGAEIVVPATVVGNNPGAGTIHIMSMPASTFTPPNQRVRFVITNSVAGSSDPNSGAAMTDTNDYFYGTVVYQISPTVGTLNGGQTFMIYGRGFGSQVANLQVLFGTQAPPGPGDAGVSANNQLAISADQSSGNNPIIKGVLPSQSAPGAVTVKVTNIGVSPAEVSTGPTPGSLVTVTYSATGAPIFSNTNPVSPSSGPTNGGTTVVLTASSASNGFGLHARAFFGGRQASNVVLVSTTQLQVDTPNNNAGPVTVQVTNFDGQSGSLGNAFTYTAGSTFNQPSITKAEPHTGPAAGGTVVTLTVDAGSVDNVNGYTVMVGQAPGIDVSDNGDATTATDITEIYVTAPAQSAASPNTPPGPIDITVTNSDGQFGVLHGSPDGFSYLGAPALSGLSPATGTGWGGTEVTINGAGFDPAKPYGCGAPLQTCVTFGSLPAPVLIGSITAGQIKVVTPGSAPGTFDVHVRNPDGQTGTLPGAYTFSAGPTPTVTDVTPSSGLNSGGYHATITGTNFATGTFVDKPTVTFGGLTAVVGSVTSTSIDVTVPARSGAGPVNVIVTNPDGQTVFLTPGFTYEAPVAPSPTSISPSSGPSVGGAAVTILGSNFDSGDVVLFDGKPSPYVIVDNPHQIRARTPGHPATIGPISVSVTKGSVGASLPNAYTFQPSAGPAINSIDKTTGNGQGGDTLHISGTDFSDSSIDNPPRVFIGGTEVTPAIGGLVVSSTPTSITLKTPYRTSSSSGPDSVRVLNPDNQESTLTGTNAYTVTVTSPQVASVSTGGGTAKGPYSGGVTVTITGSGFQTSADGLVQPKVQFIGSCCLPQTASETTFAFASGASVGGSNMITVVAPSHIRCNLETVGTPGQSNPQPQRNPCTVTVVNPNTNPASLSNSFSYLETPATVQPSISAITCLAPPCGTNGGDAIRIDGTFNLAQLVDFRTAGGNLIATVPVDSISGSQITVKTPPSSELGVVVRVRNMPDSAFTFDATSGHGTNPSPAFVEQSFTYDAANPPAISSLGVTQGPTAGKTVVLITGTDLGTTANSVPVVTFGSVVATLDPTFTQTTTQIRVLTPTQIAGPVAVTITNPDGQTAILDNGFTYLSPPVLTGVGKVGGPYGASFGGPVAGGNTVQLKGFLFSTTADKPTVKFGNTAAAASGVTVVDAQTINVVVPISTFAGTVDISVSNPDPDGAANGFRPSDVLAVLRAGYVYAAAPSISGITPQSKSSNGGDTITVNGANFATTGVVKLQFDGTCSGAGSPIFAANVNVVNAGQLTAILPARDNTKPMNPSVIVVNPDGQCSSPATYNYVKAGAPTVSGANPAQGTPAGGNTVTISGTNFPVGPAAAPVVKFGSNAATGVQVLSATSLTAVVPASTGGALGAVAISVTNPDLQTVSLPNAYTYAAPPAVTSITPNRGALAGGTSVTIAGTGFQSGAAVTIGGAGHALTGVAVAPDGLSITGSTPAGSQGSSAVQVTNPDGQTSNTNVQFTYVGPPTVTSLTPTSSDTNGGVTVTITGTNFDPAGATVKFGANAGTLVTVTSPTQLTVHAAPANGPGTVDVQVINPDGQSGTKSSAFTYTNAPGPTLSSATPTQGSANGGTVVTISGGGFTGFTGSPAAKPTVTFGGTPVPVTDVTVNNAGQLTAQSPAHTAGQVSITVTNPDGKSATLANVFRYNAAPAPSITGISPNTGDTNGGTLVTVTGANFDPLADAPQVLFGSLPGTAVHVDSATQLKVRTPSRSGAATVPVQVTNPDGQSDTFNSYVYTDSAAPTITGFAPTTGSSNGGDSVVITGTGFTGFAGSGAAPSTVQFGTTPATGVVVDSATQVTVVSPAHADGAVKITVVNPDTRSATSTASFTYTAAPPPTVGSIAPTTGPGVGGTAVVVTGTGFATGATVSFGGIEATDIVVNSATTLHATTPQHAGGAVDVVVRNPDGRTGTKANGFTYTAPPPTVSGVTPTSGPTNGGTSVTITGTNFANGATVTFGGVAATGIIVDSSTQMRATTAAHGAGTVSVVVTTAGGSGTLASAFTYQLGPAPTLTSLVPNTGSANGGTLVTLTGAHFGAGATVTFGGTPGTGVIVSSATQITVTTPGHVPGAVTVVVANADGQTATQANGFTYTPVPPPTVTSLAPGQGPSTGRTDVTITGTNFAAGATVQFGTANATGVTLVSPTQLKAVSPAHATGIVSVTVTNPDGQAASLPNAFTYSLGPLPTLASLTPTTGPSTGRTTVHLVGTNLPTTLIVTFGGVPATKVVVASATQADAVAPAHAAGAVDVEIVAPDGQKAHLTNAYTYTQAAVPSINAVSPAFGSPDGGTQVTISGLNFAEGVSVTFGGLDATNVSFISATTITAITPANPAGSVDVVATNPDGQASTLPDGFRYSSQAATITKVAPNHGGAAGGTVVTITGTGFEGGATVSFGGVEARNVVVVSDTQITATSPAHAAGAVKVTVINPGSAGASLDKAFTFDAKKSPGFGMEAVLAAALVGYVLVRRRRQG